MLSKSRICKDRRISTSYGVDRLYYVKEFSQKNRIVWFLTGSACDAVRGIDICPHDLDIEIYSKHWEKVFEDYIIEPFINMKGWVRENFGRLVIENTQIDVVADESYDLPIHEYEPYMWKGYRLARTIYRQV